VTWKMKYIGDSWGFSDKEKEKNSLQIFNIFLTNEWRGYLSFLTLYKNNLYFKKQIFYYLLWTPKLFKHLLGKILTID
jgi:hypothetical protein